MEVAQGSWFFKENEDGVFVKVNDQRIKNKKGNLMENVLEVSCGKERDSVQYAKVTFKDTLSQSGKYDINLSLVDFMIQKNDFTRKFINVSSARDFAATFNRIRNDSLAGPSAPRTSPSTVMVVCGESFNEEDVIGMKTPEKKTKRGRKRRSVPVPVGAELTSPEKAVRPNTVDEEIEAHYIGQFYQRVSSLKECPKKWLDRKLDDERVEAIAKGILSNPAAMRNAQPWLGIADITVADAVKDKQLIKGANVLLIGGLHRHAACKKVIPMLSDEGKKQINKIWVNIYDNGLTDEQVCRIAAKHNLNNTGSTQTKWLQRVTSCRQWLYQLEARDFDHDETLAATTKWKKACQNMYLETGKDVNALEPTLQAALLPKATWELLCEVGRMFDNGSLKGFKKQKPSRRRMAPPQLTQNQVGMPLQGLEDSTKRDLLGKVVKGQLSLKEMREASESVKHKKNSQKLF